MPIAPRGQRKAMRGKCERGHNFLTPGLQFHGVDRADVYYNICVRTSRCGKCALNPPTAQHLPRRRPPLAPAQRHALPEHFRSPTQCRHMPAGCTIHARRLRDAFLAVLTIHSPSKAFARPRSATRPLPRSDTTSSSTSAPPRSADARPQAARCTPADRTTRSPQRRPALPSVPLRAQKNGTAQCMCDAECLGRPSLRSVIWVGEPRAVRRRCGRWRVGVGLRPQPWALRSRRCGRVLRA